MSALFSPLQLGPLELENRIVVSPMCQYSAVDGMAQPWHLIHIGNLMMSGAGLVILEATAVEARGRITHGCLGLYSDEQEAALTAIVREVRNLSRARIGIQLGHAGRRGSARSIRDRWKGESLPPEEGAWQTCSPSALAYNENWAVPAELTVDGIAAIVDAFADAARRAVRAGFDLIEVHAAHGYLLHCFLSPLTNRRTDAYGGSLANRMRFPLEVVRAVRDAADGKVALGVRVNSTDWHPDGATPDDDFQFNIPVNTPGGELTGFEFSWQQPFTFLPEPFDGFGTIFNYTYVDSKIQYVTSSGANSLKTDLVGLSNDAYSATLYYERDRFSARVSMAYRDDYLTNVPGRNNNDIEGTRATRHVDFSASWQLNDNLELTFEGINLTDEANDQYVDSIGDRPSVYHFTGRQYLVGVRYKY